MFLRHLKKENEMNFYIDSFNFENKLINLVNSMNCTMFKVTNGNNRVLFGFWYRRNVEKINLIN